MVMIDDLFIKREPNSGIAFLEIGSLVDENKRSYYFFNETDPVLKDLTPIPPVKPKSPQNSSNPS